MGDMLVSTGGRSLTPLSSGLLNDIPRAGNDIRRARIKGAVSPGQRFSGNFVECRVEDAEFRQIDFTRCDWKDCRVTGSVFEDCDLGHASFITNSFEHCRFIRCRFPDTGISDSRFSSCELTGCDLSAVIIKGSRFEDTTFDSCRTSNRIIESSLLLDTTWKSMEIDARLIFGNFGLRRSECVECRLVTRPSSETVVAHDWSGLQAISAQSDPSPVEHLRTRYFESQDIEGDEDALAAALDLRNWGSDAVVEASLAAQLSTFAQFLLALFERDRSPIYPILILHSRNFEILTWLEGRATSAGLYQVAAGVHWILTREVEAFAKLVDEVTSGVANQRSIHLGAEGPIDPSFFRAWLDQQGLSDVAVVSVRPRNSPVDLQLAWQDGAGLVALIALFLACRTKIELSKLPKQTGVQTQATQVVAMSAGFSPARAAEYELSVRTLLPRSLMLDLRLGVNVSVFLRARRVLIDLLTPIDRAPPQDPQTPRLEVPPSPPRSDLE